MKKTINSDAAPAAIGAYSQAIQAGDSIYISGQIPLMPDTMDVVSETFSDQAHQVFNNLAAIAEAAHSSLAAAVKLTVYLTDLANFAELNDVMAEYIDAPYPARAAVQVSALPKGVKIEVDAILYTG